MSRIIATIFIIIGTISTAFFLERDFSPTPQVVPFPSNNSSAVKKETKITKTADSFPKVAPITSTTAKKKSVQSQSATKKLPETQSVATIKNDVSVGTPLIHAGLVSKGVLTQDGVFTWTNVSRYRENISPIFRHNSQLDEIALRRARDMFAKQYFEHVSPIGIGASEIAADVGYKFVGIGENIALGGFQSDEELVSDWMNSPGHRANILNPKFVEIGIAVVEGQYQGRKAWIGVQIFGKPLSLCPMPSGQTRNLVEQNKNIISILDAKLKVLAQEMEALRSKEGVSAEEYNAKVSEFNELVNQFNPLNDQTKSMAEEYNSQVRVFNVCVTM